MSHQVQAEALVLPAITIPAGDYDRLSALVDAAGHSAPQVSDYLARELERAHVVPEQEFDAHCARIGSQVTYRDDQSGRQRVVTLVWPQEADVERNRISVLTSIGAALLGMRPGQTIDWPAPVGGPRTLTVLTVRNGGAPEPAPRDAA